MLKNARLTRLYKSDFAFKVFKVSNTDVRSVDHVNSHINS